MRTALALLLLSGSPQDPALDRLFSDLDKAESTARLDAFDKLAASADPKVAARLQKTLGALFEQWSAKAGAERSRALKDLVAARRKSFDAAAFSGKQKETLKLLKAETIEKMESSVREMMEVYYFNPYTSDEDDQVSLATERARELAHYLDSTDDKAKSAAEDRLRESQRALNERFLVQVMPEKDQKVMRDNAALRGQISSEEYAVVFLTNQYRVLMGKPALRLNVKLCAASRDHSKDMKEKNFFDHVSPVPGKRTSADRAARFGTKAHGENIHEGSSTGESAFWSWFRSLGHHENMLEAYGEMGAGAFETMWTEMFAR